MPQGLVTGQVDSGLGLHRPEQSEGWGAGLGAGSSPGKGPRGIVHLGRIPWLCCLIPHTPLAVARSHRERTLLVLSHTSNSLRHTGHLTFQLGVPGWNWTTTQLLGPLRSRSEILRRNKEQRNRRAQDVTW